MKAGCGMANLNGGMRNENTLAGAGFSQFDWRNAE